MITLITNLVCEKLVAIDKKLNYLQEMLLLGLLTMQIILKITILWKKSVCKNVAKFTGKHLRRSFFFINGLRLATLVKKRLWHGWFHVNFAKFLTTSWLQALRDCF